MTKSSKTIKTSGNSKTSEPVVFFGTGPVAAESLELLLQHTDIEAVVTKPKPAGHKGSFPVTEVAAANNLKLIEVSNKKDLSGKIAKSKLKSRVGILIDFGIIVSQDVIDYFPLGIINSHFSILPEWRGADPISFALLSGQETTGVSLMLLVEAMDEGPLIGYAEHELNMSESTPELTTDLISLSDAMLKELLPLYLKDKLPAAPQSVTGRAVSYSRKLNKNDGILDFKKPAVQLEREIRAFHDWPKSRTTISGIDVIITRAEVSDINGKTGGVVVNKKRLYICCNPGALQILQLKPAGKKEMSAEAFLAGHRELIA